MSSPAKTKTVGRPAVFSDKALLGVRSAQAKSKLQANSERRAIVLQIIDEGGTTTLEKLNEKFGFDMRAAVLGLINSGWVAVELE